MTASISNSELKVFSRSEIALTQTISSTTQQVRIVARSARAPSNPKITALPAWLLLCDPCRSDALKVPRDIYGMALCPSEPKEQHANTQHQYTTLFVSRYIDHLLSSNLHLLLSVGCAWGCSLLLPSRARHAGVHERCYFRFPNGRLAPPAQFHVQNMSDFCVRKSKWPSAIHKELPHPGRFLVKRMSTTK